MMNEQLTPPAGIPAPQGVEHQVVLYVTPWCGYCSAALELLDQRGISYLRVDVSGNQEARQWLREITGRTTVPQIFIKGRSIGGYTELAALDRHGELTELTAAR